MAWKEIICKCGCGRRKLVRTADIKRGWGKYFNKSCKAKDQVKRLGQNGKNKVSSSHTLSNQKAEFYVSGFGKEPIFDDDSW